MFKHAAVLVSLQVLDLITTFEALRHGAYEINPIISLIGDFMLLLLAKVLIAVLTAFIVLKLRSKTVFIIVVLLYVQAVIVNTLNIICI